MAHYFFGSANPIGKRIGLDNIPDVEIVGVVKDAKYAQLRETQRRHFYIPALQQPRLYDMTLEVRAATIGRVDEMVRAQVN